MSSKKIISFPLALLLSVLYFSCSKQKDPLKKYGTIVKAVMRNEAGAFRGFNFGDPADTIKAREAGPAAETDSGYLYYEFKIDTAGSYNITYDFDENGLVEIQSDVFIKNAAQTDSVFNSFKKYFDDHFGKSETAMGYDVWTVQSEKYGPVKINLTDESSELTADKSPGKISIWFYPSKD